MKTIYTGGKVFAGSLPLQSAFAVENGRFCAVGTDAEVMAVKAEGDRVIDLAGSFVCPGFIDSHMHMLNFGNTMQQCVLGEATGSLEALLQALRTFMAEHTQGKGGWLLGRGWNQDYFHPASGMPTRDDLDRVTQEYPVCIVRCCGHCLVVNSCALEVLGIDEATPVPEGGTICRDENGRLNGVFLDSAMSLVQTRLPEPQVEDIKQMLRAAMGALNRVGVTSCHSDDLCTFEQVPWQKVMQAYRELEAAGEMTVRVYEQSQLTTVESLREFLDSGWNTGVGTEMFRVGPLKILGDGSLGARTAYMSQSYADAPGEKGLAIFTQEQFDDLIGLAHGSGMQVAVHAIGDGILDRILNAYEKAFAAYPQRDHRSGIVHVQLTREDQLRRMRDMQMHAYVQSIFIDYDAHIVYQRAGEKLASTSYAFRTMKQMGLHVSNGTDCPVEGPNPMRGIQCAVTRCPIDGSLPPYRAEEAMTVEEALQSYTAEGAYASFEETFKGRIQPGMAADFVVLEDDPFATEVEKLAQIGVKATYLGGEIVYQA